MYFGENKGIPQRYKLLGLTQPENMSKRIDI